MQPSMHVMVVLWTYTHRPFESNLWSHGSMEDNVWFIFVGTVIHRWKEKQLWQREKACQLFVLGHAIYPAQASVSRPGKWLLKISALKDAYREWKCLYQVPTCPFLLKYRGQVPQNSLSRCPSSQPIFSKGASLNPHTLKGFRVAMISRSPALPRVFEKWGKLLSIVAM